MELTEWILQDENMDKAIKAVKRNRGAYGIDKMFVEELDSYFAQHREEVKTQIREGKYKPNPVRRVYIPKTNGKKRPLGIPTVVDRVVQQMTAQVLSLGLLWSSVFVTLMAKKYRFMQFELDMVFDTH